MLFSLRARQRGTLQTLSVGDGLTRRPISDCAVYILIVVFKERMGSVIASCVTVMAAAAFCGRLILSSFLADFASTVALQLPKLRGRTRDGLKRL
jgi:hypothetical protein